MLVQIINVASATSRMAFQRIQMDALGLEWERLEAITPQTLPVPSSGLKWKRWERPMRKQEIALLISHCFAWRRVIAAGKPQLIIEDDALLAEEVPEFLKRLEEEKGIDHVTLEVRSRRKLVGRKYPTLPMRRLYQDRTGSAAFILWPSGAEKLVAHAENSPGPSDAVISSAYKLNSWQADPGLALQLDQCAAYGMTSPINVSSSIAAEPHQKGTPFHRLRRIAAQFRMGFRQISRAGVASWKFIPASPNWPTFVSMQAKSKMWSPQNPSHHEAKP